MNRTVLTFFTILCLLSTIFLMGPAVCVQVTKAGGTIYIKVDGSIDPLTASITSVDNVTYYFTSNINNSIIVERDNIIIDGMGYTLQGTGAYDSKGMLLSGRSNITIKNTEIKSFWYGIHLWSSSSSNIHENNIKKNKHGIFLSVCSNNNISGNCIIDNEYGIWFYYSSDNTIFENDVRTNNLFGIWFGSLSNNNIISANNITNNGDGVCFEYSSCNNVSRNNITANTWNGIWPHFSSNNTILGNSITNNGKGICLDYSPYHTLRNNTMVNNNYHFTVYGEILSDFMNYVAVTNTLDGKPLYYWVNKRDMDVPPDGACVVLVNCTNITVQNLDINKQWQGILLVSTTNSTITRNNITNSYYGFRIKMSSNNKFYHNNLINNNQQVHIAASDCTNFWDNGLEGNYWSEYAGVDANHDGLGDSQHIINANNTDNYPLMGMFFSFNTSLEKHVNIISNSLIEDFEYFESNSTIKMHVSGLEDIGFCRICVSHMLMNLNNISVVIDGGLTPVLYNNYTLYDNSTHRWIYFAYPHSIHEVDIISEFPSLIILPLFMVITLLAVIVYKKHPV